VQVFLRSVQIEHITSACALTVFQPITNTHPKSVPHPEPNLHPPCTSQIMRRRADWSTSSHLLNDSTYIMPIASIPPGGGTIATDTSSSNLRLLLNLGTLGTWLARCIRSARIDGGGQCLAIGASGFTPTFDLTLPAQKLSHQACQDQHYVESSRYPHEEDTVLVLKGACSLTKKKATRFGRRNNCWRRIRQEGCDDTPPTMSTVTEPVVVSYLSSMLVRSYRTCYV